MKRTAAMILSLLLAIPAITACTPQSESSSDASAETSQVQTAESSASEEELVISTESSNLIPMDGWSEIPAAEEDTKAEPGTLRAVYEPQFAEGFSIEYYHGGAKIIDIHFRETTSVQAQSQRILLLPDGATEPVDAQWDQQINGKVERVVTLASSHAGHFANLSAIDTIKGTSISASSCRIPALAEALESGQAQTVTKKADSDADTTKYFDQELVASLDPQVVFVGGMAEDITAAKKLQESGFTCVYIGDFAEENYVGRAQWIELFGAFIDKEQEGHEFLRQSVEQANEVIARAEKIEEKPNVLWFTKSGTGASTQWFVKTDTDYTASFIHALGGNMIYPEGVEENSIALSGESFLVELNRADKLIFGVSMASYPDATDMTFFNVEGAIDFSATKAFQNDDCYAVGNDWSQDTANIGEIMKDLAKALYPEEFSDIENPQKIVKFKR
ncbi:MAG: ABC transporter substrate-binding protein [Candidatus Merdivicinus sp.]|jgi:ABC-type Fe3+-hydroxamate transport system substrate-binding protein